MNIVNLMANDVWSEGDIVGRTEAMITSRFGGRATTIMNRKVTAAMIGQYTMTAAEKQEVGQYAEVCAEAAMAGNVARQMMDLLRKVLAYEAAEIRLAAPESTEPATITVTDVDGVETEEVNPLFANDVDERMAAQSCIDGATVEVTDLVQLRRPPVVVEVVEEVF